MVEEIDVYKLLHQRLVAGGFVADLKLQPELLRKDYQCSASTIREALFRLSTFGLVSFKEQRGFRVPKVSRAVQHELDRKSVV